MATRLYPDTDDPDLLERLAGVPAGTFAALEAFETSRTAAEAAAHERGAVLLPLMRWAGKPVDSLGDEVLDPEWQTYQLRKMQPALHQLRDFMIFGWGRLANCDAVESAGLDVVCDGTEDPALMCEILGWQAEDPEQALTVLLDAGLGLRWC